MLDESCLNSIAAAQRPIHKLKNPTLTKNRHEFSTFINGFLFLFSFECQHAEKKTGFPFTFGRITKIGICFTNTECKFSIFGEPFATFKYRTPNLLGKLNGFKITGGCGLRMEITSIDHIDSGSVDGNGSEKYSYWRAGHPIYYKDQKKQKNKC